MTHTRAEANAVGAILEAMERVERAVDAICKPDAPSLANLPLLEMEALAMYKLVRPLADMVGDTEHIANTALAFFAVTATVAHAINAGVVPQLAGNLYDELGYFSFAVTSCVEDMCAEVTA